MYKIILDNDSILFKNIEKNKLISTVKSIDKILERINEKWNI